MRKDADRLRPDVERLYGLGDRGLVERGNSWRRDCGLAARTSPSAHVLDDVLLDPSMSFDGVGCGLATRMGIILLEDFFERADIEPSLVEQGRQEFLDFPPIRRGFLPAGATGRGPEPRAFLAAVSIDLI